MAIGPEVFTHLNKIADCPGAFFTLFDSELFSLFLLFIFGFRSFSIFKPLK